MRPKRASKRYSVTREDCQLDPRITPFPPGGTRVHPVPCIVNGKHKYRLDLVNSNDNICGLESLSEEIRMAGYHVQTVENMLNMLLDIVPRYIARTGRSVRIGDLFTLKPCATGTLDYANDTPDPKYNKLEIRGTISPALRHSLVKVPITNVSRRARGIDFVINNADMSERDKIDLEVNIDIHGKGVYVSPQSATDEDGRGKVWVETMDGRRLGRCAVLFSGPDMTTAKFVPDAPVDVKEGLVFVETYGTQEAAEAGDNSLLQRYSRNVRFITA